MIFRYSKYPKAAKEYLRFMMEEEQISPWVTASIGYVTPALTVYEKHKVWSDPKAVPYRDAMKIMLPSGYSGKMGYASAGGARRLHHREHGGGGGVGAELAEGCGGAGAEAGGALLQGVIQIVAASATGTSCRSGPPPA